MHQRARSSLAYSHRISLIDTYLLLRTKALTTLQDHRHHERTVHPAAGGSRRRRLASRKGTAVGCERAWREGARSSLEHPHLSLRKQEHPHLNGRSMLPTLGSHAPAAGGWDAPATEGWDAPGGSYGLGLEDRYLTTPPPRPCLSGPGKTTGTGNGPRGLS